MFKLIPKVPNGDLKDMYGELFAGMLVERGVNTLEEADSYLNCKYELQDPFVYKDMTKTVALILDTIDKNEVIGIYHDNDCDGTSGVSVFVSFLKEIGHKKYLSYMNSRESGVRTMTTNGMDFLIEGGAKLIITIDLGINSYEAVDHANKKGAKVVITDHHLNENDLPKAEAIINPAVEKDYPYCITCGAGTIFKVIQALLQERRELMDEGKEKWLLDLVSIATVADSVILKGENRALVKYGLMVLKKSKRFGINSLISEARLNKNYISETDIGFSIAPVINSACRFNSANLIKDLWLSDTLSQSNELIKEIYPLNKKRKTLAQTMSRKSKKLIKEIKPILVLGSIEWEIPFVSSVAQSISTEFGNTVFAWGRDVNTLTIRGSVRSKSDGDVTKLIQASGVFKSSGGHKSAAGFELDQNNLSTLEDTLNNIAGDEFKKSQVVFYDGDLKVGDLNNNFFEMMEKMSPFGVGNRKPVFKFCDVEIKDIQLFGSGKKHSKFKIKDETGEVECRKFFENSIENIQTKKINIYATVEFDSYNRKNILQVEHYEV